MEVVFYQYKYSSLEKILPKLLEKAYANQQRSLVVVESKERVKALNLFLWTFSSSAFLPHGCEEQSLEMVGYQPIWITTHLDNLNQASLLIITTEKEVDPSILQSYKKCLDIFDGHTEQALRKAKARQDFYQNLGYNVLTWQQNAQGGWEKVTI